MCKNGKWTFRKNTQKSDKQNEYTYFTTTVNFFRKIAKYTIQRENCAIGYLKIEIKL